MLVLARKLGEKIVIGERPEDQIEIEVVEIRGERVRLGITAPADKRVDRAEVSLRRTTRPERAVA